MAMYAVAITPLIHRLKDREIRQVWFADDAKAGGNLTHLKTWWDNISELGPEYGYHPNASKTWLIVSEGNLEATLPGNRCVYHRRRKEAFGGNYWYKILC